MMLILKHTTLQTLLVSLFFVASALAKNLPNAPSIQLANIYHSNINIQNYLVSEKLDGLRVYFDGKNLISRMGDIYNAPKWFTKDFPPITFEGELWIGRGKFEEVSGIVRNQTDDDQGWQKIRLMIFDLPKHNGIFKERLEVIRNLVKQSPSKYLKVIEQSTVADQKTLIKRLEAVVKNGGEGLMLHRVDSLYKVTRNDDLLKLKTFKDAEARVLAVTEGKGKYQGMMGALLVENEERVIFKVGGGFSDKMRKNPPAIGSIITYKYYGKTKNNKPRFASFLRLRNDYDFTYR